VTLPSYAFNFYLDLIAGHIIPMQNATDIGSVHMPGVQKNITTEFLQDHPVELHIMPSCIKDTDPNTEDCHAKGRYINDDGLTTDLTQRHNYDIAFNFNKSATAGAAPD